MHRWTKGFLVMVFGLIGGSGVFALAPYPAEKILLGDLPKEWKTDSEVGKALEIKKVSEWENKVVVQDGAKLVKAFIKYSVRVEYKFFFRTYNVVLSYIHEQNSWIFERAGVLSDYKQEQKPGVVQELPKDKVKTMIKEAFEAENKTEYKTLKPRAAVTAPVTVQKVLITKPEITGEDFFYYADLEFTETKESIFSEPKTYLIENLGVGLVKKGDTYKIVFRTHRAQINEKK